MKRSERPVIIHYGGQRRAGKWTLTLIHLSMAWIAGVTTSLITPNKCKTPNRK